VKYRDVYIWLRADPSCSSVLAHLLGLRVCGGTDVCLSVVLCCASSGRGLCVGLITRLGESYRLFLWVWSRETITSIPTMRRQTEVKTKEWRSIWKGLVMSAKSGTYSPLCRMQAVRTWFQFYKGWSIQLLSNFKPCQLVQDNCSTRHTATHPKVYESSSMPLSKPQIIMRTCCHL